MNFRFIYLVSGFILSILVACSTDRNTLVNRTYHGTTARYNGYFNANELLTQAVKTYRASAKENYYEILPVDALPSEEDVKGMYPAIDTAISKSTKVITRHSMPSADKPSKKKEEHNHWIDENWLMIGMAKYYRRDYIDAQKNFEYVRKFYADDPSNYVASLWMAKAQIESGSLTDATLNLKNIDKAIEEQKSEAEDKSESGSKRSKSSSSKAEKKKPEFPKKMQLELDKTKASLALAKSDYKEAILQLEAALTHTKKSAELARIHFILAQLNAKTGSNEKAKYHYGKVLKYNAPFEMSFNARISRAFMGGDGKIKKELNRMLRDEKNSEFKDQIYYALADIAFQESNKEQGISYLHRSAFYSTTNKRQKGQSYERLGDVSFADRDYVKAQKYYDSCARVIPENYPNAAGIKNKADKLHDLVVAVETAYYEDSVQRIAQLSPEDREKFAEKLIKQIHEEEARKKREDEARMRELQSQQAVFNETQSGNKWYWNNARTRAEGFNEFRKQWGARENEDDWRRSEKIVAANQLPNPSDSIPSDSLQAEKAPDTLSVESLLANLPFGDSAIAASNERLLGAYYDAGIIYKEQLNEPVFAKTQFQNVLDRNVKSDYNLMSSYQLYKLHEGTNEALATENKNYILANYPNSDYANYLRDPDYFVKRKEMEKLAEQEYVVVLDRYNRGLYYPVISKADLVIEGEKENPFRSKYMLLKALSFGQLNEDKQTMVPVLEQVIAEYPATSEEAKAKELMGIIKNGYSVNIEADFSKKSMYNYHEKDELWMMIFLDPNESSSTAKTKVADFNKEFFSKERLNTSSKIFSDNQSIVVVKPFDETTAGDYVRTFKKTRKHLLDLQNAKILYISQENMKVLFETKKLVEYEAFFEEYY
jgi:hypothetical protein